MKDLPEEVFSHYISGVEGSRLMTGSGQLEFLRTRRIIQRYFPKPPARVYDVGGAWGVYSCWLAREGYDVSLIDPVPDQVERAQIASDEQAEYPISECRIGDARSLPFSDNSADAVLLLGPLYHLTEREDRIATLREAYRVLRAQGVIITATISRYASLLDGWFSGFLDDPKFENIVDRDLKEGQHRNPSNHQHYFTTAYFHHPNELKVEMKESGFQDVKALSIEGPCWLLQDFNEYWEKEDRRNQMLHYLEMIEEEPSILGISAHISGIGRKSI